MRRSNPTPSPALLARQRNAHLKRGIQAAAVQSVTYHRSRRAALRAILAERDRPDPIITAFSGFAFLAGIVLATIALAPLIVPYLPI